MRDFSSITQHVSALTDTLDTIENALNFPQLRDTVKELELKVADPSLWDDTQKAQETTSLLSRINGDIQKMQALQEELAEIPLLVELAQEEPIEEQDKIYDTVSAQLTKLDTQIDEWETKTLLSGEYDERQAYLSVRSGAGGVDAADWAQMLLRMYMRWADAHNYPYEVLETSYAEEAGIKSATVVMKFTYAYGILSVETGTHRLVRISPFDNQGRRHTSFAEVEILPIVDTDDHIDINESDLKVDVYRSSGPGGQSVNTTDSAVRLTHLPTGIVVTCQNEKSQLQNKTSAMKVLASRLLERKRKEEQEQLAALKKDGGTSWGNQIRSYVLHPYQMVKDLRTECEVSNPTAVLDGDIQVFLDTSIKARSHGSEKISS